MNSNLSQKTNIKITSPTQKLQKKKKKKKKKKRTHRSIWQENNLGFYLQENNLIQFSIQIFLLLRDVVAVLLRKHFFF